MKLYHKQSTTQRGQYTMRSDSLEGFLILKTLCFSGINNAIHSKLSLIKMAGPTFSFPKIRPKKEKRLVGSEFSSITARSEYSRDGTGTRDPVVFWDPDPVLRPS